MLAGAARSDSLVLAAPAGALNEIAPLARGGEREREGNRVRERASVVASVWRRAAEEERF